jgi:pimeloyl-ACP methyl ester carboxylesterase
MPNLYCIWALILLLAVPAAAQPAPPQSGSTAYNIFLRGSSIGREDVTVVTSAEGTTITVAGRMGPPVNAITRKAEFKYAPDWTATSFTLDGSIAGGNVAINSTFSGGKATTTGTQAGTTVNATHDVAAKTFVLPNGVFGGFAAVARRLAVEAAPGAEFRAYVLPLLEISVRVETVNAERMQSGTSVFNIRRYDLSFMNPGGALAMSMVAGEDGNLIRLTIPAQGLDIIREDVAASTSRTQIYSNPSDEAVIIPAVGFNLGATITRPLDSARGGPLDSARGGPRTASPPKIPAVILLAGSGIGDRDGVVSGVPILAQLAGALADAGFLAVRYDKRGFGQSGGRAESATLSDYAEDVRAVVKWLGNRNDVDSKRIAVVGHSEGSMVALIAAGREKRLSAVVSLDGPASTGSELVLEQQQHALEQANVPAAERQSKVALQKQILSAVISGEGWQGISPEVRRQADTPWFQSLLTYDPVKVLDDVRQPMLIVHGELDRQVPVAHADKLADLARKESKSKSVDVVVVRGVNHLLVPAITGEVSEYGSLKERTVSKDVTGAVTTWLSRTFQAIK